MRCLCKGLSPVLSEHPHHGPALSSPMQSGNASPSASPRTGENSLQGAGIGFAGGGKLRAQHIAEEGGGGRFTTEKAVRGGGGLGLVIRPACRGRSRRSRTSKGARCAVRLYSSKAPRLASSLAFHFFVLSDAQSSLTVVPSPVQPDRRLLRLRHGGRHTGVQLRPFQGNDT